MEHKEKHLLYYSLSEQLTHGMQVSNLAYEIGSRMKLSQEDCHELAVAGLLHDVGKMNLMQDSDLAENTLMIEEMKYIRTHPQKGYQKLTQRGYSDNICHYVLYHHENYDGSGYPYNLRGQDIPLGARILRVCDAFCALIADRPYRRAFSMDAAMELVIEEIKNFDMEVFLTFMRIIHDNPDRAVKMPELTIDVKGELLKL